MPTGWRPTAALSGALAFVAVLLPLAVVLRRPDLAVLAAPVLVGTLLPLLRRPGDDSEPAVEVRTNTTTALENQAVRAEVSVTGAGDADVVRLGVGRGSWLELVDGRARRCTVPVNGGVDVTTDLRATRWGRSLVGPVTVTLTAAHGLLRRDPVTSRASTLTVVPLRDVFDAPDVMPRAEGMVGPHRSRRRGDGTDLAGIRPFTPGDRLRRINWPVSLRSGQLHVTSTLSDRDTDVMLILDTAVEVGVSEGIDGAASSLDVSVRAAASLAEYYLRHGDRVGLIDLGAAVRPVRPAGGRAHLNVLFGVLLDAASRRADDVTVERVLTTVPPRALVMVLSTLLEPDAGQRAATLALGGHTVLVVDTLPTDPLLLQRNEWTSLAWRLVNLERQATVDRLAELGVPTVGWRGPGSLDEVLRDLSRAAAAPRLIR